MIEITTKPHRFVKIDISGHAYGRLSVVKLAARNPRKWLCRCSCGMEKEIKQSSLVYGKTRSCGCLRKNHENWHYKKEPQSAYSKDLYGIYRRNALKRGLSWNLSLEQFLAIIRQPCTYCGDLPMYPEHHARRRQVTGTKRYRAVFAHHGVDRSDSSLGYSSENSVPSCKKCNLAKGKMNRSEFLLWIKKISNNLNL